MNSEGTVDLPGNDFDSNDFDAVDLWGADGAEGWTADPIIGVGSAATLTPTRPGQCPRSGGDGHRTRDRAFYRDESPRTVSVSTLMDGRIDHVELSARVAWMSESQLASEILVIADLARQKAQSAQYAFILDRMSQQVDADEHRVALLRKTVGETWGYHRRKKPRQQKLRCSRRATATIVQHQTTRAIHGELNRPGRCGDSGAPRVSRLGSQFAAQH